MNNEKLDKIYNRTIEYIEDVYYNLTEIQQRIFIIGYLSALRDNKIINDVEHLILLDEYMQIEYH